MESLDFGHEHPLVFNEKQSNQSEEASPHKCSKCGELMSDPSYSCAKCRFYLHKECAEAPLQIDHPFHSNHTLCLLPNRPAEYNHEVICDFCSKEAGKTFVYHCSSCDLDFHIKCALVTYNLAEKKAGDQLKHIACKEPSISTGSDDQLQSAKCCGCWEPLLDSTYYSLDYGFNIHQKCAELPFQLNHPLHKHPLILQLSGGKIFSCVICQDTYRTAFCYCCSLCNFGIHIACLSPPSIIEDKGHQHQFKLFFRLFRFTCDACGIEKNCVPYMCSSCNLLVHKKCISLPRVIKFLWHEHPISHTYALQRHESEQWECVVCHDEVNTEHGSYHCRDCRFIVHVDCVIDREGWYYILEPDEKVVDSWTSLADASMDSFTVIDSKENGEATKIKHFMHAHNLILSEYMTKADKYCDGCSLFISDSFYCCSGCQFFLHKECAEFPKMKHFWFHMCHQPLILTSKCILKCCLCENLFNGFAYTCYDCKEHICLRCATPITLTIKGHEHPLSFYVEYKGHCSACGNEMQQAYACKGCKFALHSNCATLPLKVRHKCDEHPLTLTYHDDNSYSESQFCDICEEYRNPNIWFYNCAICDTSTHTSCILGRYPFLKWGKSYGIEEEHPHSLTLVKKMYHYPKCFACDEPCQELALECAQSGCDYIVHFEKCLSQENSCTSKLSEIMSLPFLFVSEN